MGSLRFVQPVVCLLVISTHLSAQVPASVPVSSNSSSLNSYVQGYGTGTATLKPTVVRLSIPIRIVEDASWDAAEKLRAVRKEILERTAEMGAIDGTVRTLGFQCHQELQQTITINRGAPATPRFVASCYLIADFAMREMQDHEETIAVTQAQLEELVSLIPKQETARRRYSISTLSSGLTNQQLENPQAFFVAQVSEADRNEAYKSALQIAKTDAEAALDAMGIESAPAISVHRHSTYSTLRMKHPIEAAIFRPDQGEAISLFADAVTYTVRLSVSARF